MNSIRFVINEGTANQSAIDLELRNDTMFNMVNTKTGSDCQIIDEPGTLFSFWYQIKEIPIENINSIILINEGRMVRKIVFPKGSIAAINFGLSYGPKADAAGPLAFHDCFSINLSDGYDWTKYISEV